MNNINEIFRKQKQYFNLGTTKDIRYRISVLKKLRMIIKENEERILEALQKDLGKSSFEAYATEIGMVYEEINIQIKNINKWSKKERRKSPITYFPAKSYIYKGLME